MSKLIDMVDVLTEPEISYSPLIKVVTSRPEAQPDKYENFTSFQRLVSNVSVDLKEKYEDRGNEVESVLDLVFGPFRVEQSALTAEADKYQKETSARIQHNIAHAVVYAGSQNADQDYVHRIHKLVNNYEKISHSLKGSKQDHIPLFWNGIKAEISIIKALQANGYQVHVPDYMQDALEIDDNNNQVLQWDVNGGIDLIAGKEGSVYLIDCKGKLRYKDDDPLGRVGIRDTVDVYTKAPGRIPDSAIPTIRSLKPSDVRRAKIIVPTAVELTKGLTPALHTDGKRASLSDFASLKEYLNMMMTEGLKKGQLQLAA